MKISVFRGRSYLVRRRAVIEINVSVYIINSNVIKAYRRLRIKLYIKY